MKKLIIIIFIFVSYFASANCQEGSIFYVHGFLRSCRCMLPLSRELQKEGFSSHFWNYPSRNRTIEEHAAYLVQDLKTIALAEPGKPIHFITHSLGGIIVRAALNHPECPWEAKCGCALLLAPPNKGAKFARSLKACPLAKLIFGPKAGKQLLNFEEADFESLGHFPPEVNVCVVAGSKDNRLSRFWLKEPNDGKVAVYETYLSTPHMHYTFSVNHTWIMTHKKTIFLAKDFLKSSP